MVTTWLLGLLRLVQCFFQPKTFIRIPSMQEITVTNQGDMDRPRNRKTSIAIEYDIS